jgi:hypothetical protein
VVGFAVVGAAVVGLAVVGAAVVGRAVVGAAVVGRAVVGAAVVGFAAVGRAVVGAAVVGLGVVGAAVVGRAVVGAAVVGLAVVGLAVVGACVGAGAGGTIHGALAEAQLTPVARMPFRQHLLKPPGNRLQPSPAQRPLHSPTGQHTCLDCGDMSTCPFVCKRASQT